MSRVGSVAVGAGCVVWIFPTGFLFHLEMTRYKLRYCPKEAKTFNKPFVAGSHRDI